MKLPNWPLPNWLTGNRRSNHDVTNANHWSAGRYGALLSAIGLFFLLGIGIYWSVEPDFIDTADPVGELAPGAVTVNSLIDVIDLLLNKPGGYLSNDVMPPAIWLDNIPSWEFGVLVQIRDLSKALRESFSRSQSQSSEDRDLALAESRFNVDHTSWAVPWPEREYSDGRDFLAAYGARLGDDVTQDGEFFARADNLRYWLSTVETRLGSLSQRLSASVGQRRINGLPSVTSRTLKRAQRTIKTPWLQVDNVFYEARGTTWALLQFLRAVQQDFADVLEKKNASIGLQQIIRELEMSQQPVNAPMIVNGRGFGLFANHSLVMASYISRANAALIDLRELLSRG